MTYKIDEMLIGPGGKCYWVEWINRDFISVVNDNGAAITVMPEDYDKYKKVE